LFYGFVAKFGVGDNAVFLVKGQYPLVMFYVGVNGEEPGGAVISITGYGQTFRAVNHKRTSMPLYFSEEHLSTASFAIFMAGMVRNG
jgi:hypothetical protein